MTKDKSPKEKLSPSEFVKKIKAEKEAREGFDYRRASLVLHGHTCARCGRTFEGKDLPLLTVHHKDSNHFNNPRDGSNWENLCIYCHENEHARGLLGDLIGDKMVDRVEVKTSTSGSEKMVSLADKLKAALEKKK